MTNAARIGVGFGNARQHADIYGVFGQQISIKPQILQDYCASILSPVEEDLVIVAGAVAFADRILRRRRASGWRRDLELSIAVNEPDFWNSSEVLKALVEALCFVSGDNWGFNFVSGAKRLCLPQSSLDFTSGPYIVLPFSDGLDSFLQWKSLRRELPNLAPLRIQSSTRALSEARNRKIEQFQSREGHRLAIPVQLSVGNHPEPSFRTRTFLFFSMAALAAAKAGADQIVIGENGVGALGPSLIPYGDECPHRTTHPGFTRRLAKFLNIVLKTDLTFDHPQLWRTKGEVISIASGFHLDGWEETNSCVRGFRDRLQGRPCGVCSGCLLRRMSVERASLDAETFFWHDLSKSSLDESRYNGIGRAATKNDKSIMLHSAHSMNQLARLAELSERHSVFRGAAWELSHLGDIDQMATSMHALICRYAAEWRAFVDRWRAESLFLLKG